MEIFQLYQDNKTRNMVLFSSYIQSLQATHNVILDISKEMVRQSGFFGVHIDVYHLLKPANLYVPQAHFH